MSSTYINTSPASLFAMIPKLREGRLGGEWREGRKRVCFRIEWVVRSGEDRIWKGGESGFRKKYK